MNNNTPVRLADISLVGAGQGAPQQAVDFGNAGEAFIRAGSLGALCDGGSLSTVERVNREVAKKYGLRLYLADTVVFAKSGMSATKNRIYRLPKPCYVVNHLATVEPSERVNAVFLRYFLESFNPTRLIKDISYPSISQEHIGDIRMQLPDLPKQKRVAELLENANRLRRTRHYVRQLGDTFLQSVFLEMFGNPLSPRLARSIARLEDILEVQPQNGLYVPREQYASRDDRDAVEMVHMSDLFNGIVATGKLKRVNINKTEREKYALCENDLLIARRSINYEGAAKPCRIPALSAALVFESSMIRVRPDRAKVLPVYLYYYLSCDLVRRHRVRRYVTISTISGINQDGLKRIEIVVPPLPLQQKFAAIVQRFERLGAQQREAERQAKHLFQALLHRAFSDRVQI